MNTGKRDDEKKREEQEKETAFDNGQSPELVKKNPDPRANGNLPDDKRSNDEGSTTGPGSEITDGEDG